MSSGGQDGHSFIPRWNEEAATLESFDQRVKLFVSSSKKEERCLCGPMIVKTIRLSVGPKSIQEGVRLLWISSDMILFERN